MRLRPLLALTGPVLLMLPGCTSDLPAPTNFVVPEPLRPPNELVVDCEMLPLTANGATYAQTPTIDGQLAEVTYEYTVVTGELPAGIMLDPDSGELSGVVEADPGTYAFEIQIAEVAADADVEEYSAVGSCTLQVNPRLDAALALDAVPFCLQPSQSLLNLVVPGTGDGTPITCDYSGGNGNGRIPGGMQVESEQCVVTGSLDETRYGTWVFMMRGVQSGAEVFVPYCATNDLAQGYDITGDHSGRTDVALQPIMRTYDPTAPFTIGGDGDPHYEVLSPGTCGASCFYRYSFLRTNAPIADNGFSLEPDGLVQDAMMQSTGFFHELQVSGPAVPGQFLRRPWVLSVAVSYCLSGDENGCDDVAADGDGALELGLIMVPN